MTSVSKSNLKCRPLVAVSFKMYLNLQETYAWTDAIVKILRSRPCPAASRAIDIAIFPTFPALYQCGLRTRGTPIELGAQNLCHDVHGPYTGEVSAEVLRELNCCWVVVGHAERRRMFGETDQMVAEKGLVATRSGLRPLICIGEREMRGVSYAVEECIRQARSVLERQPANASLVLAYEPVWAIGAERPADHEHVNAVLKSLREAFPDRRNTVRYIYGGSAGAGIYRNIAEQANGLFLGRFAHDPQAFATVLDEVCTAASTSAES